LGAHSVFHPAPVSRAGRGKRLHGRFAREPLVPERSVHELLSCAFENLLSGEQSGGRSVAGGPGERVVLRASSSSGGANAILGSRALHRTHVPVPVPAATARP